MSDFLTDEEQVDRLKKLWKDYGITVATALVVGIGGVVGWDYIKSYQSGQAQAAADLYTSYMEAAALGEPTSLIIEELEEEHGDSSYLTLTLMREAKAAVDASDYERALDALKRASEAAEGTPLGDMVTLRKAKVEFELADHEAVLETIQSIETAGYRWQAMVLKGDVHFSNDELDAARDAYRAAKEQLPDGFDSELVDMRVASVPPAP